MLSKNVETFIGCDCEYLDADIVIFGAPYDSSTSFRPGTRFASKAIRGESFGLETYSPYLDKDLTDCRVFDAGDLELPFGSSTKALESIAAVSAEILADGKLPVMIGGEHLVTYGNVKAVFDKYPDLYIIHFDAHTDLRDDYLGEKLSHASVIRRCVELIGDKRVFQYGIRSGEKSEFEYAAAHTELQKFNLDGLNKTVAKLKGKKVYFTIDLDVLDPSVFPGTGTPEAGGICWEDLRAAISAVCGLDVVGADINELSPVYDASGASTAVACKTLRELLLSLSK